MLTHKRFLILVLILTLGQVCSSDAAEPEWRAGLARAKITPQKLFWMAGFAARTRPAEGTGDDLWVKVLALEAANGHRGVFVSADLVGMPKRIYDHIFQELHRRHGLARSQLLFAYSHTHSGPVLSEALQDIYPLDDRQRELIADYSRWLEKTLIGTVGEALSRKSPVTLWAGQGKAGFALNRRTNRENELADMFRKGIAPKGPSDFAVPVMAVRSPSGTLQAVVFGYSAHTSMLSGYQWSADYAGFTQRILENTHPNAQAMFFQGCGADQSAVPRGTREQCQKAGENLAAAVAKVLAAPMRRLTPRLNTAFQFIALDFSEQPTRTQLETTARGTNYQARWARRLLSELKAGHSLAKSYPEYPVEVWKLGQDQLWIALGGEVVVDYALRFKRRNGEKTWVAGYANDVMAYIPSRRVWEEGGYQAGAFEVYGLPAVRWTPHIEERIAATVEKLRNAVE